MFHKFNERNTFSTFIKQLLATEKVPTLSYVKYGDYLVKGCQYLYQDIIVDCTKSGYFKTSEDDKPVAEVVYKERNIAEYTYSSNVSWYDSDTHKHLGRYLRYVRDTTGVDMMPFYNCYTELELNDIYLDKRIYYPLTCSEELHACSEDFHSSVEHQTSYQSCTSIPVAGTYVELKDQLSYNFGSTSKYRVMAVPVKFDTQYTIAVDSIQPVTIRGVIYDNGLVKRANTNDYYADFLEYSCVLTHPTTFSEPFVYSINLADLKVYDNENVYDEAESDKIRKELYKLQNHLYMLIQIPRNPDSALVVLEGNYVKADGSETFMPSLLHLNPGISYAFSDRLIEYLLLNTISPSETISSNISRIQQSILSIHKGYRKRFESKKSVLGMWDSTIPEKIMDIFRDYSQHHVFKYDQDGNVNKDIEFMLNDIGAYKT